MLKSTPKLSEILSLVVMLLMVIALIAAQADATMIEALPAATEAPAVQSESSHFRLDDE